jgi:diketogulonate reductase-like aldo/keto reductase
MPGFPQPPDRVGLERNRAGRVASVKAHRIAENIDISGFALTAEEVAAIDPLDTAVCSGPDPTDVGPDFFS